MTAIDPTHTYYNPKNSGHRDSLANGEEFQDFATDVLRICRGFIVQNYTSRKYQRKVGEGPQRIEFKRDNHCTKSKRLSVEIAEKFDENDPNWKASGIFHWHNPIFYVQGNFEEIWVFLTRDLKKLAYDPKYERKTEETLKAFYLPFSECLMYSIFRIEREEIEKAKIFLKL